jgi:dTDP-4-amino-4,6-dideoxygalactose transaminase
MSSNFLPLSAPSIGPEEIEEVIDTLQSGWLTTGPKTHRFEQEFGNYVGAPESLGLSSCTAGLHLALACLGVGPGDEVITTPLTFAASANVIEHVGATPVLADVEPDVLTIDPEQVERAITPRTKAILPVHYAGHPANVNSLQDIAKRHGLSVVEDAAHAIGASYNGRPIGSGDNPTSFSFYATKNLTTGEGGMLTGTAELVERARGLALHGLNRDAWKRHQGAGNWYYEVQAPGFKYNMTDLQASLGIWQLRKLAGFQSRRREIANAYNAAFEQIHALETPACRGDVEHAWHLYVLRLRTGETCLNRESFIEQLKEHGIGTSVHFVPIHLHPFYRDKYGYKPDDFPIAHSNYQRMLSLPLYPGLTDQEVQKVINAVYSILGHSSGNLAA